MSRIRLTIDRLVLNGFNPLEGKVLSQALQAQLSEVLSDRAARAEWLRSYRAPVLKLGRMPMEHGSAGASKFGRQVAHAVWKGPKP